MKMKYENEIWNVMYDINVWNIFLIMIAMTDQTAVMFMLLLPYWKNESSPYCFEKKKIMWNVAIFQEVYLTMMVSIEWILEKVTWSGFQN